MLMTFLPKGWRFCDGSNRSIKATLIRAGLSIDCETSRLHAENIVKELGFLPLAIDQAACFIHATKHKIEDFLPLYRQNFQIEQNFRNGFPKVTEPTNILWP
jgi:hypothetical protein